MIALENFLVESRSAPLFHGTTLDKLDSIIERNHLMASADGYTSLTRSFAFAQKWSMDVSPTAYCVIELDQSKLTHNHKIVPYNYFNDSKRTFQHNNNYVGTTAGNDKARFSHTSTHVNNEYEEAVKGGIKDFNRFVTAIYVASDKAAAEVQKSLMYSKTSYNFKIHVGRKSPVK